MYTIPLRTRQTLLCALLGGSLPLTVGAQTVPPMDGVASKLAPGSWQVLGLPAIKKPWTRFDTATVDTKTVLRIQTDKSYGNLTYLFKPATTAGFLSWRWRVDQPVAGADLRRKDGDDTAIKVCALFDLPLEKLNFLERNLLRMARSASGQHLPAATVCYVWDPKLAVGTELTNAFTKRVHYVVLNSTTTPLQQWASHRRDLRTDFMLSFHTESASVPPLLGIAIGADADNTAGSSLSYLDDLTHTEP